MLRGSLCAFGTWPAPRISAAKLVVSEVFRVWGGYPVAYSRGGCVAYSKFAFFFGFKRIPCVAYVAYR